MSKIFISYRRADATAYAGRLYDRLSSHFGRDQVFMDINYIEPGEDFIELIKQQVGACSTVIVLIGRNWLNAADQNGARRLDDPEDFVRLEIITALARDVRVMPVLVGGTSMPLAQQLPEALSMLSRRHAAELSDTRFHHDVDRLIQSIEKASTPDRSDGSSAASGPPQSPNVMRRYSVLGAAGFTLAILAFVFAYQRDKSDRSLQSGNPPQAPVDSAPSTPQRDVTTSMSAEDLYEKGKAYYHGVGVNQDYAEAAKWYQKAANQGNSEAQFSLGQMYYYARGLPKDDAEAVQWYRKAAEQGHAGAQHNLGVMYHYGRGLAKDEVEAVQWYRKAATQGYALAQFALGVVYANGYGVSKDSSEAVQWYRKAAEQGNPAAQNNLGAMYARGVGVQKDEAEALKWYRKAAEQGHAAAQSWLNRRGYK